MPQLKEKSNRNRPGSVLLYLLPAVLLFCMLLPRCAQIVAPTGGPKDTLPPILLSATPPDSTLHFKAHSLHFGFNEFIQLQDLQKQMIISPTPEAQPEVTAKLRELTFNWSSDDTLLPNTTYIINMGDAIRDVNESNPIRGFRYVFSTGDYLDSLEITGKVLDAETGLPDSTALVMLYTDLTDSVVSKEKPVYYARCLGDGSFRFQNLPHDTFKVFAVKDDNGDLRYGDSTEAIAFLKHPIQLDREQTGLVLALFKEKEAVAATPEQTQSNNTNADTQGKKDEEKKKQLGLSASASGGQQDLKQPLTLTFTAPLQSLDSNGIVLQEDSVFHPVSFKLERDSTKHSVSIIYDWKESTPYRLLLDSAFAVDTSGTAYAKKDTLKFTSKSLSDYGTLTLHFIVQEPGSPLPAPADSIATNPADSLTTLMAGRNDSIAQKALQPTDSLLAGVTDSLRVAETDSNGSLPVPDTLLGQAPQPTDSLASSPQPPAASPDTGDYQLLVALYKNKELLYSGPMVDLGWTKGYLPPGEYHVRVIKDYNKNGQWDRGCYYCQEKRQPEPVYSLPDAFTIRANWKNDFTDLKVQFERSSRE